MVKKYEMKLMDLAAVLVKIPIGSVVNFTQGPIDTSEEYGGWIGIKRIDEFS